MSLLYSYGDFLRLVFAWCRCQRIEGLVIKVELNSLALDRATFLVHKHPTRVFVDRKKLLGNGAPTQCCMATPCSTGERNGGIHLL